ncbi:MAG: hypothetical protein WC623_22445 [Pedobacter sp.]|uniref:hypothetical protein n=1 Tax=Pedobacter sp. TaxID=1411316 RepID=UPI0035640D32
MAQITVDSNDVFIVPNDALVIHKRVGASGQISVGTEYAGRLVTAYVVIKKRE